MFKNLLIGGVFVAVAFSSIHAHGQLFDPRPDTILSRAIHGGNINPPAVSSRANPLGGFDYSNGVTSRPNPLGGMDYSNGVSCRPNPVGGVDCR